MLKTRTGPFNAARLAENFATPDPIDAWCDELQLIVHGLTRPGAVNDLRHLREAERVQFLADLRALQARLVEALDADRLARAFTSRRAGERQH